MRAYRCVGPDDQPLPVTFTQDLQALWGLMGLGKALLHNLEYLKMPWQVHFFFFLAESHIDNFSITCKK